MNNLLILGVGPHAIEMVRIVERINEVSPTWNLLGHIARDEDSVDPVGSLFDIPVLGKREVIDEYSDSYLAFEHDFLDPVDVPRERWASLVDPACFLSPGSSIGAGCVLYPRCFVGSNARLGDRAFVLSGSIINHDDTLEDSVSVAGGVMIAGSVSVERGCYLGQGCNIRQMVRVGAGSLIGMGAVVLDDVAPNSVMVGNPARRLRDRR